MDRGTRRLRGPETLDASGRWVVPGFVDAHIHVESSKLLVDEFARLVLPLGTTAVVADPHEIANVLGTDGVHWLLDACDELPLDVYFMASSCVPASRFESPRRALSTGDLQGLLRRRRVLGLAEMMNFPGVIAGDEHELAKLRLEGAGHVDGHAPGVLGKPLNAYASSGIRSDHEAYTVEEGRERLRAGMWLLIREASGARNLHDLIPLVERVRPGPDRVLHRRPRAGAHRRRGPHQLDGARSVEQGIPPEDALVMATLNRASWHGLAHLGALAPGYQADLLLLPDLERSCPSSCSSAAGPSARSSGRRCPSGSSTPSASAHLGERLRAALVGRTRARDRRRPRPDRDDVARRGADRCARARRRPRARPREDRRGRAAPRHRPDRPRARARLRAARGALASTIAHDAHNIVVVGMNDDDMARAVARLAELGGGIVVVRRRGARGAAAADRGPALRPRRSRGGRGSRACVEAARRLGCTLPSPFQSLAFLALSVIPSLKLTDRGLVDVDRFELVPLQA